jgi:hypothetical protein
VSVAHDQILARLNLHAVFPCLAVLVRLDDWAQSLMAGERFGVRLKTRSGLSSRIDFLDGDARIGSDKTTGRPLELLFLSDRQLNNTFSGSGWSLPIPVGGLEKLTRVRTFNKLAARLQQVLRASPTQLADEKLLALHTDLLIGELIPSAIAELVRFDDPCRRWLAPFRNRSAWLQMDGGASSWLRFNDAGAVRGSGPPDELPDVVISFRDRRIALAAMQGDLDNLAALGNGQMTVRGMIPLADALDRVLDRLDHLMNARR